VKIKRGKNSNPIGKTLVKYLFYPKKCVEIAKNKIWVSNELSRVTLALIIIFVMFTSISKEFIGPFILPGILLLGAELGIIAIGEALLIISGEIDLSVASVYGWGVVICTLLTNRGLPFPLSALIAVAFGCLIGLLNGFITLRFKVPSLITTLASMWVLRGLLIGVFGGYFFSYKGGPSLLLGLLEGKIGFIPRLFFWLLGFGIIFNILLTRTKFGNWVFATGGDKDTAKALGVNTYRVKLTCFMISSGLAAFAGVAYLGRTKWFMARIGMSNLGYGLELEAIFVAIMGGTSFSGGVGNISAVCLAALAFSSFKSGLTLAGISGYWLDAFVAILLIVFCVLQRQGKGIEKF